VILDIPNPEVTLFALHLGAQGTQGLAQQVDKQAQAATVRSSNLHLWQHASYKMNTPSHMHARQPMASPAVCM
jgi:hypothetical protein